MSKEYNNPFKIAEKIKEELGWQDIEITNIQHDDYFGGSWMIDFLLNNLNYRFVWDGRESWLILVRLGENKSQKQNWEDIETYRYHRATRTSREKEELERFILENIKASLEKLV
ncbi:hypothetical protein EU534_00270 [Candidatus Heimdallarchaeota archaeon]|nr:MAG: hypothetical protein EU534_00270 [Candidatus Heimdallarchaeota archaeon]